MISSGVSGYCRNHQTYSDLEKRLDTKVKTPRFYMGDKRVSAVPGMLTSVLPSVFAVQRCRNRYLISRIFFTLNNEQTG